MRITFGQFHDIVTEMFSFKNENEKADIINDWYIDYWESRHFMTAEEFLKGRYGHCSFNESDIQFKGKNG